MKKPMLILLVLLLAAALTLAIIARQEPEVVPAMSGVTEATTATPTAEPTEAPTATPTAEPTEAPEAVGGEMTLKAQGYQSEIIVSITVDGDGVISAMTVDAAGEAPGLGRKCAEERWTAQFIGELGPFALTGSAGEGAAQVDAVSYATVTSQAVVDAVNALLNAE